MVELETLSEQNALWIARAAVGDPDAQASLANAIIEAAETGSAAMAECVAMAELMGRMVAVHGRPGDKRILVQALLLASMYTAQIKNWDRTAAYEAEVIALLNELADEGDEEAGEMLQMAADVVPAELLTVAAKLRRRTPDDIGFVYQEG